MDIYWIDKNKQRVGPVPEVVIVTKLETGEIDPDTKGWHKGCSGWLPIEELPALSSYFRKADDEPEWNEQLGEGQREVGEEFEELSEVRVAVIKTPGLMVRLFARFFDYFFYMTVVFCLMTWLLPSPGEVFVDVRFRAFFWFPWIFIEAGFIKAWGTTPGKFICGIKVHSLRNLDFQHHLPVLEGGLTNGEKRKNGALSFSQSLKRSIQVMFFGVFFLMDVLAIFAGLFSLYYIRKNGISLWDRTNGTTEYGKPRSAMDWVVFVALFLGLMMISGYVTQPWLPSLSEFLGKNK